jgi:hypothetical protein
MAGKTLINGTAYDITGGTCLKDGTSYSVKNGKVLISGTEYDISFLLPSGALSLWSSPYVNCEITCIAYGNGYWVVGGVRYDAGVYYARIAYATSLDGPWTAKNLWRNSTSTFGRYSCINCITYANGVFVVGGGQYLDTASEWYPRIAYTASPNLTWTIKDIWTGYRYDTITGIAYGNGYWVVGGMYGTGSVYYARIAYATSLGSTWTTKDLWGGTTSYNSVNSIVYGGGYFVLCGSRDAGNTPYARIAYATTPTSWTQSDLWSISSNYNSSFSGIAAVDIAYGNGYWVVCGTYANSDTIYTQVAYTKSLSGTWTTKTLYVTEYTYCRPTSIAYANGEWVVCNRYTDNGSRFYGHVWYGNSPSTITNLKSVWGSVSGNEGVYAVAYADGYLVVGGMHYDGTAYNAQIAYASAPDKLPTVT